MCLIGKTQLLCMQCSGIGHHLTVVGKSHCFSQVAAGTWGMFSSYGGMALQNSCFERDISGFSLRLCRAIGTPLEVRRDIQGPMPVATVVFGFLSIFERSQASSPFEALNSMCLSRCQRDVRPPIEIRQGTRAFSRVSTGDSDIPSSCEMKDEPAF